MSSLASSSAATQTSIDSNSAQTQTGSNSNSATANKMNENSSAPPPRPMVGVAVLLICSDFPDSILVGKRISSHGSGTLQLPGGHLEFGEDWAECGARELAEETNISISPDRLKFAHVTNDRFLTERKHYITLFMKAEISGAEARDLKVLEPQKCSGWEWRKWENLKITEENLFLPLKTAIQGGELNPFK